MNQIKLFIQQKNIVINNLSLNFNDIKDIKEKTKLIYINAIISVNRIYFKKIFITLEKKEKYLSTYTKRKLISYLMTIFI